MQIVIHVVAKRGPSLRERLEASLPKARRYSPWEVKQHTKGRSHGWAKAWLPDHHGVLNFSWDDDAKTLVCRAITRNGNRPDELVGKFVAHLLAKHGRRIMSVTIHEL